MASRPIAAFLSLLLATPGSAQVLPAADYERAYEAVRLKARTAYLAPAPIDAAVTEADLKPLAAPPAADAAARVKKTAELLEAIMAVKTLQGAPSAAPVAPTEKLRLMTLVYRRLALSGAEQSRAIDTYARSPSAPFGAAPTEAVLGAAKLGEEQARLRALGVMGGAGALRDLRAVEDAVLSGRSAAPSGPPMSASEFRPQYFLSQGPKEVPPVPSAWNVVVDAAKTPLPFVGGWAATYGKFAEGRLQAAEKLDQEGAALLEKGGAANTVTAGWKAAEGFAHRLVAGDPTAVTTVAVGAAAAVVTVLAAPAVLAAGGVAAGVLGAAKVGLLAYSAYGIVQGVSDVVKQPDYANAGALALNFVGIKYIGPLADKVGQLTGKAITAAGNVAPKSALAAAIVTVPSIAPVLARAGAVDAAVVARGTAKGAQLALKAAEDAAKDTIGDQIKGPKPAKARPSPATALAPP